MLEVFIRILWKTAYELAHLARIVFIEPLNGKYTQQQLAHDRQIMETGKHLAVSSSRHAIA